MRIGIFSGTFDPIHLGHILTASACQRMLALDEVLLAPFGKPLARVPEAGASHRFSMLKLALSGQKNLSASDIDLIKTPRYAIDTVSLLKDRYPGASLVYIVGADKAADIPTWKDANNLMKLCTFAVHPRAGYDAKALMQFLFSHGADVTLVEAPQNQVSSGQIRAKLRLLSDAPGMLHPDVAEYIAARGLYQPDFDRMVRQAVSPDRFAHSKGVRETGTRLARIHGLPMQKAGVAGILHDNAKCMELSRLQTIARQFRITRDPLTLSSNALLHGPVGAHIAQMRYHIADQHILSAIRFHTTGRAGMEGLELCIFVADAIEPGRNYPGVDTVRAQAETSLIKAALTSLCGTQDFLRIKGSQASPLSRQAMMDLTTRMNNKA